MNKKILTASLLSFLVGVVLTAFMAYALTPSTTIWISPGIYPGAPSYTIWKEGSNYFAKDQNGFIPSWSGGTNFTTLSDLSIDNLPVSGGRILLKNGDYSGTITIDRSNVILDGEGVYSDVAPVDPGNSPTYLKGTVITPASGKDGIYIKGSDLSNIQIRNLGIWFKTASTGSGITTDTDTLFHLRDGVIENIMVLDHDADSYAIQMSNFLFVDVRHILSWGGPLLHIYANRPNFQQGNSIWDDLYGLIKHNLVVNYVTGPYPIFINRNDSEVTTRTNLMDLRRVQVNNPTAQTDADYYTATFWALEETEISGLNLEGVTSTSHFVQMGGCLSVQFNNPFMWAMYTNGTFNIAVGNQFITVIGATIHGNVTDGGANDTWINPYITGIITVGSTANFVGLKGNSGYGVLAGSTSSVTINARFIGPLDSVLLTVVDADSSQGLKVEGVMVAPTNQFVVKTLDETNAAVDTGFYWTIMHRQL